MDRGSSRVDLLPEHHARWVRLGLVFSVLAYGSFSLIHILVGRTPEVLEVAALVLCSIGLSFYERAPRLSGLTCLGVIWVEVVGSLAAGPDGPEMLAMSFTVLPVLVVGTSQLLGPRWAWTAAAVTGTLVPAGLWTVRLMNGQPITGHIISRTVILEISLFGTAALLGSFFRTITELVARERGNAGRIAGLIDEAPDAIVALSDSEEITAFNELAARYLGVRREHALGSRAGDLPSWPLPELSQLDESALSDPQELEVGERTLEVRIRRHSATDAGSTGEWMIILRDVSERKAAEERSKELTTRLEQAQRMEAIGQLAGGVAHDFNNLLTAVGGSAYVLEESSDPEAREIAGELEAAAERGSALTRRLLTFARREVVQESSVNVGEVLTGLERLIRRLLGERIVLDIDVEPGCTIRADQGQLEQVVLNLAANARDAMHGSGTFSLTVARSGDRVEMRAEDTGDGIDELTRERIFEPFFTTKSKAKGTGLGLSTVHGIVSKWGGEIRVESEPGAGASFLVCWPYSRSEPGTESGEVLRSAESSRNGHILLVEDDPQARRFVERLLKRKRYQVTVTESAEAAWLLWKDGLRPDMLVSDVILPGITGAELAQKLRAEAPELPLLLISGYLDDALKGWPFDTTEDLLLKPFAPDLFLRKIRQKLAATEAGDSGESVDRGDSRARGQLSDKASG